MAEKTIEQHERDHKIVLTGITNPKDKMSLDDFREVVKSGKFIGVDHEQREQFLKENGYEVNRENLIDTSLSTKQKED